MSAAPPDRGFPSLVYLTTLMHAIGRTQFQDPSLCDHITPRFWTSVHVLSSYRISFLSKKSIPFILAAFFMGIFIQIMKDTMKTLLRTWSY
jgi:hypothetical protein